MDARSLDFSPYIVYISIMKKCSKYGLEYRVTNKLLHDFGFRGSLDFKITMNKPSFTLPGSGTIPVGVSIYPLYALRNRVWTGKARRVTRAFDLTPSMSCYYVPTEPKASSFLIKNLNNNTQFFTVVFNKLIKATKDPSITDKRISILGFIVDMRLMTQVVPISKYRIHDGNLRSLSYGR